MMASWVIIAAMLFWFFVAFSAKGDRSRGCAPSSGNHRVAVGFALVGLSVTAVSLLGFLLLWRSSAIPRVAPSVPPRPPSLGEAYDRLTAPKIVLETDRESGHATQTATTLPSADADKLSDVQQGISALQSAIKSASEVADRLAKLKAQVVANETVGATASSIVAQPTFDKPRPAWVDDPPKLVGDSRRSVVTTDPLVSAEECRAAIAQRLDALVQARVVELAKTATGDPHPRSASVLQLQLNPAQLFDDIRREEYIETLDLAVGEMQQAHVLVEFTPKTDDKLLAAWREFARRDGLVRVGSLAGLVLGVVASVFSLLKIDAWTRGYYSKRLFLGVPAAIITAPLAVAACRALFAVLGR